MERTLDRVSEHLERRLDVVDPDPPVVVDVDRVEDLGEVALEHLPY